MSPPGLRSSPAVFRSLVCLLLAAGSGCGGTPFWLREEKTGPLLEQVKVSELRPGSYCEIEMVLPPLSSKDSFHCYKGTVKEIDRDEVVLTNVLDESWIDYGASSQQRPPTQQKRELVHVPLTGVDAIWALPPAKGNATASPSAKPPAKPSDIKLPSSGAQPLPPPATASS